MNKKIGLAYLVLCVSHAMIAMDQPDGMKTKKGQLIDLVAPYLIDHQSVCSFAIVNKACLQSIRATVNPRKKKLLCPDPKNENVLGLVVHKWGSAYCCALQGVDKNRLMLSYNELGIPNPNICTFGNFESTLPYRLSPFLNEQEEWCFDGCTKKVCYNDRYDRTLNEVVRYNLSSGCSLPIRLWMPTINASCEISTLQNYPSLLKSILSVKKAKPGTRVLGKIAPRVSLEESYLEVNLDDVTLESDWSEGSYPELNEDLKKELEEHYAKQLDKK